MQILEKYSFAICSYYSHPISNKTNLNPEVGKTFHGKHRIAFCCKLEALLTSYTLSWVRVNINKTQKTEKYKTKKRRVLLLFISYLWYHILKLWIYFC